MSASNDGSRGIHELSVTRLFNELQSNDWSAAAQELWSFLQRKLFSLSRKEVSWSKSRLYDEEDVALSAFNALCQARHAGKYQNVADRDEIWRLLAVITVNKARKFAISEIRERRGGEFSRVENEADFLNSYISADPSPEFNISMQEECQRLLDLLKKKELQMVALLKVEGYSNEETAQILGCTRRAVQRRLVLIRDIWANEVS